MYWVFFLCGDSSMKQSLSGKFLEVIMFSPVGSNLWSWNLHYLWEIPASYLISRITLSSWDTRVQRNWKSLGILVPEWLGEGWGGGERNRSGRWGLLTVESTCSSLVLKRERIWKPRSFFVLSHGLWFQNLLHGIIIMIEEQVFTEVVIQKWISAWYLAVGLN